MGSRATLGKSARTARASPRVASVAIAALGVLGRVPSRALRKAFASRRDARPRPVHRARCASREIVRTAAKVSFARAANSAWEADAFRSRLRMRALERAGSDLALGELDPAGVARGARASVCRMVRTLRSAVEALRAKRQRLRFERAAVKSTAELLACFRR